MTARTSRMLARAGSLLATVTLCLGISAGSVFVPQAQAAPATINVAGGVLVLTNNVKIGQTAPVGFTHRYTGVATGVDALLTVKDSQNATINNVDRVSTVRSGSLWSNLAFPSGGGSVAYRVEFVATGTRTPVLLQNFSINVNDIDAKQFVEFTGPSEYRLATPSELILQTNANNVAVPPGALRFVGADNASGDPNDPGITTEVTYSSAVSAIDVRLGANTGGVALFEVLFGAGSWGGTTPPPPVQPPTPPAPVQFTVSYDLNTQGTGITGTPPTATTAGPGISHTVAGSPTVTNPNNYVFLGWNTQPDGEGPMFDASITANAVTPTVNMTLYAIWGQSIVLSYNANGGSGTAPAPVTINAGAATVSGAGGLSLAGYEFAGWNTASNLSGQFYEAGSIISLGANTTLYAVWRQLPAVPTESPVHINDSNGSSINGATVEYVVPNQTPNATCDPLIAPQDLATLTLKSTSGAIAPQEIDAACMPDPGESTVYGTAVLDSLPQGVFVLEYENPQGQVVSQYFEVSANGTLARQSRTEIVLAKTGSTAALLPLTSGALTAIGVAVVAMMSGARRSRAKRESLRHVGGQAPETP